MTKEGKMKYLRLETNSLEDYEAIVRILGGNGWESGLSSSWTNGKVYQYMQILRKEA